MGAENPIQAFLPGLSSARFLWRSLLVALSFLYLAFVRTLSLLRLRRRETDELAVEIVMLRPTTTLRTQTSPQWLTQIPRLLLLRWSSRLTRVGAIPLLDVFSAPDPTDSQVRLRPREIVVQCN